LSKLSKIYSWFDRFTQFKCFLKELQIKNIKVLIRKFKKVNYFYKKIILTQEDDFIKNFEIKEIASPFYDKNLNFIHYKIVLEKCEMLYNCN
jgi:hypothetical protein